MADTPVCTDSMLALLNILVGAHQNTDLIAYATAMPTSQATTAVQTTTMAYLDARDKRWAHITNTIPRPKPVPDSLVDIYKIVAEKVGEDARKEIEGNKKTVACQHAYSTYTRYLVDPDDPLEARLWSSLGGEARMYACKAMCTKLPWLRCFQDNWVAETLMKEFLKGKRLSVSRMYKRTEMKRQAREEENNRATQSLVSTIEDFPALATNNQDDTLDPRLTLSDTHYLSQSLTNSPLPDQTGVQELSIPCIGSTQSRTRTESLSGISLPNRAPSESPFRDAYLSQQPTNSMQDDELSALQLATPTFSQETTLSPLSSRKQPSQECPRCKRLKLREDFLHWKDQSWKAPSLRKICQSCQRIQYTETTARKNARAQSRKVLENNTTEQLLQKSCEDTQKRRESKQAIKTKNRQARAELGKRSSGRRCG